MIKKILVIENTDTDYLHTVVNKLNEIIEEINLNTRNSGAVASAFDGQLNAPKTQIGGIARRVTEIENMLPDHERRINIGEHLDRVYHLGYMERGPEEPARYDFSMFEFKGKKVSEMSEMELKNMLCEAGEMIAELTPRSFVFVGKKG